MCHLSAKSILPLLALGLLISASLACGGGLPVPTQGAPATNPPQSTATLQEAQPTNPPEATTPPEPTPSATLSERGTPDEAKAMLQKAVEHYNAVGREQALADFTG